MRLVTGLKLHLVVALVLLVTLETLAVTQSFGTHKWSGTECDPRRWWRSCISTYRSPVLVLVQQGQQI